MKKDASIYFDLIISLKTTQEVTSFVSEIDALQLTFFKSEKTSMEKALTLIRVDSTKKILQFFSKNSLDINNRDIVINFFETLKELIGKLKIIKLTIAFNPTSKTVEKIYNYVKDILGVGYVLDVEVSEDILGGSIVIFNGKYNDFTLRKEIEDAFASKNDMLKLIH